MTFRTPALIFLAAQILYTAACTKAEREAPRTEAPQASSALATKAPGLEPAFRLRKRTGPKPETSQAPPGTPLAHRQLSQQSPVAVQEELFTRAAALPDVMIGPSGISVPGARAFILKPETVRGPRESLMVGTEFGHIHPAQDGSLHMMLPPGTMQAVFQQGWGEPHPRSGTPMVYGPRDQAELEVVWQILLRSYEWAHNGQMAGVLVE